MMATQLTRVALVLGLLGVLPAGAYAQDQGRAGGRDAEPPALTPAEVLNMLDAYALVQAQNALQIADEPYARFVIRLKQLQQTRRRNQQIRNRLLQDLRRLTGIQVERVDEDAVRDRLKALRDHDERSAAELRQGYASVDEVLDVRQQARFRIFEENLERRTLDLLMRARRGGAGRGQ